MARTRSAGPSTGILVLLVSSILLFLLATVLAIVFYTQKEEALQNARDRQQELDRFATTADRASPSIAERLGGRTSVVRGLVEENDELRSVLGIPAGSAAAIRQELALPAGETLATAVRTLRAELADARRQTEQVRQAMLDADERAAEAQRGRESDAQVFGGAQQELEQQLAQVQQRVEAYEQQVAQQRAQLEQSMTESRGEAGQRIRELQEEVARRDGQISDLQARIDELTRRGPTLAGRRPDMEPDGQVVAVLTDQNSVYIDLGRGDHVTPGLTFEVFDRREGIPPPLDAQAAVAPLPTIPGQRPRTQQGPEEPRGKGTVEVVSVGDSASLARIVRLGRGEQIIEGDLIANAVYDRHKRYKFVVFGDFDIERSGQATVADRRRIETMIREWGGTLADQLTYDVDFLVLGLEPPPPGPRPTGVDPVPLEAWNAAQQKYETYQRLILQARDLAIPVLNQNRFLNMVGHYRR